jgi:glycosyltransferase involved in cell wall biosynthesis
VSGATHADPLDIALLFDSPEENWPSMDLVGDMLLDQWRSSASARVTPTRISIPIAPVVRRLPGARYGRTALNADRALSRYVAYPVRALMARRPGRFFHVVDHSYAQLVHVLPSSRTGVYCHDLDALRPVLERDGGSWPIWRRGLAWTLAAAMKSAALVFHSTREVGRSLERHGIAPRSRLVYAPYGAGPEFNAHPDPQDGADAALSGGAGHPFVLHVGSEIPRKRLDVLFEVFARLRSKLPELRLVQQGARLSDAQRAHAERLGIAQSLIQPPKLTRKALAGLYRRAAVVLVTSEAEGFGLPVIEALACGAVVIASDIPVLREVGENGALYAPVGDIPAWTEVVGAALADAPSVPPREHRIARAGTFTWNRHAETILEAYRGLHGGGECSAVVS